MEVPSESGGSNITQYLIDVDTVSTFSSTALVTLTVDSDEVRPPARANKYPGRKLFVLLCATRNCNK